MRVDQLTGGGTPKKEPRPKPGIIMAAVMLTVHNVHILDSSGSMSGSKYNNAVEGVNADIKQAQTIAATTPGLTSTMSVIEFSNGVKEHSFMQPVNMAKPIPAKCMNGGTALYQTIGETIEKILSKKKKGDKVLLKIFTDGEEAGSRGKYAPIERGYTNNPTSPTLAALIKKVQEQDDFTVTFVGTKYDTERMIKNLNVDASNTLVHDNTAQGVKMSYQRGAGATAMYLSSAMAGEDVSKGFYSKSVL